MHLRSPAERQVRRRGVRLAVALAVPISLLLLGGSSPEPLLTMPIGDLPGWRQIFRDDFTTPAAVGRFPGTAYGATWAGYSGFADTSGHGRYAPSKVLSVSGGSLNFHLHTENGVHLVAAPVPLFNGRWNGQKYGRYSIRFRADPLARYKVAFLLWPSDNQWAHGEVDFPEGDLNGVFYGASRRVGTGSTVKFDGTPALATFTRWHVATIEWTPGKVAWLLDGIVVGSTTIDTPTLPMRWTLQAETGIAESAPADSVAGNVQVDWVTAYSYAPGTR